MGVAYVMRGSKEKCVAYVMRGSKEKCMQGTGRIRRRKGITWEN